MSRQPESTTNPQLGNRRRVAGLTLAVLTTGAALTGCSSLDIGAAHRSTGTVQHEALESSPGGTQLGISSMDKLLTAAVPHVRPAHYNRRRSQTLSTDGQKSLDNISRSMGGRFLHKVYGLSFNEQDLFGRGLIDITKSHDEYVVGAGPGSTLSIEWMSFRHGTEAEDESVIYDNPAITKPDLRAPGTVYDFLDDPSTHISEIVDFRGHSRDIIALHHGRLTEQSRSLRQHPFAESGAVTDSAAKLLASLAIDQ
jgi:hypothetical protein